MSATDPTSIDLSMIARLKEFILSVNPQAESVGLDTQLIEEGVMDSMAMVNFLLYIEELRGAEIPEQFIQPEYFTTLRVIFSTFFAQQQ